MFPSGNVLICAAFFPVVTKGGAEKHLVVVVVCEYTISTSCFATLWNLGPSLEPLFTADPD